MTAHCLAETDSLLSKSRLEAFTFFPTMSNCEQTIVDLLSMV